MGFWDPSALREEAEYFHSLIFGKPIPPLVAERYVRLHEVCFSSVDGAERRTVERLVALRLDAEAVECVFRLRRRKHLLTQKLHALLYLVEVRREYYFWFFNEKDALVTGKLRLMQAVLSAAIQTVRGMMLIRRYALD